MKLVLDNIGIIKKADIELNGLTVIAGENDTGKSTVGKALYMMIKTILWGNDTHGMEKDLTHKNIMNKYIKKIFKQQISKEGKVKLEWNDVEYEATISSDYCSKFTPYDKDSLALPKFSTPIFIESPLVWNLYEMFSDLANVEQQANMLNTMLADTSIAYPTLMHELYFTLALSKKNNIENRPLSYIKDIIGGEFRKEKEFYFYKDEKKIELVNTATGIKYFGILQVLLNNNHLSKNQILILDEPEVHLHPKWQLELVKIIVALVKDGVKILVNSHSPYMIEACQRYAKKENIPNNFYFAEEGIIKEEDEALSKIFKTLSEPFDEFDKMDSESLNG